MTTFMTEKGSIMPVAEAPRVALALRCFPKGSN
jgi:hypothetical protein